MADPIRAALERLVEVDDTVPHNRPGWEEEWRTAIAAARAALATPPTTDEPAVPQEGREPAAVVSEDSDWFSVALAAQDMRSRGLAEQAAGEELLRLANERRSLPAPAPVGGESSLAHKAYIAFVQICKGNSDDAGTYDEDEKIVRNALARLHELEVAPAPVEGGAPSVAEIDAAYLASWCKESGRYDIVAFARAILSRWGRPAAPPAPVGGEVGELVQHLEQAAEGAAAMGHGLDSWAIATGAWLIRRWSTGAGCFHTGAMPHLYQAPQGGEVGELVAWLREEADDYDCIGAGDQAANCRRAATLVQSQATELAALRAVEPIPVSEQLPGSGDCDAEGRCWIFMPDIGTAPSWRLVDPRDIGPYHTHWLPAHALPLPAPQGGEVE